MNSLVLSESNPTADGTCKKTSLYEKAISKAKLSAFFIHYHLLQRQFPSFWVEVIVRIIMTFQALCFSFDARFDFLWKPFNAYNIVKHFVDYFQLGSFLKGRTKEFFLFFFLCLAVMLVIIVIESLMIFKLAEKGAVFKLLVSILQKVMYSISTVFYIPVIKILLGVLRCEDFSVGGVNDAYLFYASEFKCYSGVHYFFMVVALIFLLYFIIKVMLFSSMYFETSYDKANPIGQMTGRHEVYMRITTLIYLIFFDFISKLVPHCLITMILCIFLFINSFYSFLHYYLLKPHYNQALFKINCCLKVIIIWCDFCLIFERFVGYFLNYSFSVLLFCCGIPLVLLNVIFKEKNDLNALIRLCNKQSSSKDYVTTAMLLVAQIDQIDNRCAQLIIRSYADCYERTCTLADCPLKKYLQSMNNKEESIIFILKHIETVYQNGMKRYPYCIFLRINYCRFLIERTNKRQFAYNQFKSLSSFSQFFEEQFIIYRYTKIFEETGNYRFDTMNFNESSVISLQYMNDKFRKNVLKASLLYVDFWTLLYQSHLENQQNLSKLNEIGRKIQKEVREISNLYTRIHLIVNNDKELVTLYYDFASNVLRNGSKMKKLKRLMDELNTQEDIYSDLDLNQLDYHSGNATDRYLYMLINAQYEDIGKISNISLGLCSYFGYTKEELWGKSIDILIPNILQKGHHSLLKSKLDLFIKNGCEMKTSKPKYADINVYGLTKAKYLLPFNFKHCLLHAENQENYWLIKVLNEHKEIPLNNSKTSHILTDMNMTIQYFTGNSINLLGLNSFVFSTQTDITKNIKELHEELYLKMLEIDDKSVDAKGNLKRSVVKEKYKTPMMITWMRKDRFGQCNTSDTNEIIINQRVDSTELDPSHESNIKFKLPLRTFSLHKSKDICFLTVSEIAFNEQCAGFLFKIEKYTDPNSSPSIIHKRKLINMAIDPSKKAAYVTLDPKNCDSERIKVDKNFLPQTDKGINFNPTKMAYLINHDYKSTSKEASQYLRHEALMRLEINQKKKQDSLTSEEDSSTYSNDTSSIENNANEFNSSEHTEEPINPPIQTTAEEYYKVDLRKIRLFMINYKHLRYDEETYNPTSKVEDIIATVKLEPDLIKDRNKCKEKEKDAVNEANNVPHTLNEEGIHSAIIHQIEKAISNKDSQESIVKMAWISLVVFIIIIANNMIFLFTSLASVDSIQKDITRLESSYNLIQMSLFSMFFARELILDGFKVYDIGYMPKEQYRQNIQLQLATVFANMTQLLDYLAATASELPQESYDLIYNDFLEVELIFNETIFTYNLSLLSSMNKLSSSLYQMLLLNSTELYPLQPEVFFFTRNIINLPFKYLTNQSLTYEVIFTGRMKDSRRNAIIIFCVANLFTLFCYYFIVKFYDEVILKKDSYLEVFYEIKSCIILSSLNQCAKFVEKNQNPRDADYNHPSDIESYSEEEDVLCTDSVDYKKKNSSREKQKHKDSTKEEFIQKIHFLIILLVTIALISITLIVFCITLDQLTTSVSIYVLEHQLQTNLMTGFNILREYLFDTKGKVLGHEIEASIQTMYNSYIQIMQRLEQNISSYSVELTKEYMKTFFRVKYQSVCNYSEPFFKEFSSTKKEYSCKSLLSNAGHYGISIVLSTFAAQMNDIKSVFLSLLKNVANTSNNFNLTQITSADLINQKDLSKDFKLLLYTHPKTIELIIAIRYMIYPIFTDLNRAIEGEITYLIDFLQLILIILLSIFSALEVLWFAIRWRHYVSSLNKIIYKAKNMLTIIPKEILVTLSSIYKLLQIKSNSIVTPERVQTRRGTKKG